MTPSEEQVAKFVSEQTGVFYWSISPATTLFGCLGVDGEDGIDLLDAFGEEFGVDITACDAMQFFGPECCPPWAPLHWLATAFRTGTREERVGLKAISIADLAKCVEAGRWVV
jgi:acyl carrier protein